MRSSSDSTSGCWSTSRPESGPLRPRPPSGSCGRSESSSSVCKLDASAASRSWLDVVSVDPQLKKLSLLEAIALVTDVASRADQVAQGLRALREPQAGLTITLGCCWVYIAVNDADAR